MDGEYIPSLGIGWEINEEYLIKPPLPEQFRRQILYGVALWLR